MRILHMMLSCFYIEGYNYQENVLPRLHVKQGHIVRVIASCVSFGEDGKPELVQPCKYKSKDGFIVERIPYRKLFSKGALRLVRTYPDVYKKISQFKPDVIFFHGCSAWEIKTVARYKKNHPYVKLYVDNHGDRNNSAQSAISRIILHKIFYRSVLFPSIRYIDMLLCPSIESMDFCREMYRVPISKLEFYPLGGVIRNDKDLEETRNRIRSSENLNESDVVFTHSGKIDSGKRTNEIIGAFVKNKNNNFRLWIIGTIMDDVKDELVKLIDSDSRIKYFGWKQSNELQDYLCASDFYVQPGGQSATMQNAMCNGCALMLYPHKSHKPYIKNNGFYVKDSNDIKKCLDQISVMSRFDIDRMRLNSLRIAKEILDYEKMAERVTR